MGIKNSNEITLKIKGSVEDFESFLKERGFKITETFYLDDIFMVNKDLDLSKLSSREILSKALLIREVGTEKAVRDKCITYKKKELDENGNILSQSSINLKIDSIDTAEKLLTAIDYKRLMHARENDKVYSREGSVGILVKDIVGEDPLIEIETTDDEEFDSVEKLVNWIKKEGLPVYLDNFFVKKAEIILDKLLNRNS